MFASYQRKPHLAPSWIHETVSPTVVAVSVHAADEYHALSGVTEDLGPGVELENNLCNAADAQLDDACRQWYYDPLISTIFSQSMSLAYQREGETLFGTAHDTKVSPLVPSNGGGPVTEFQDPLETAQLVKVHPRAATIQVTHSCLETATCQWPRKGNSETCDAQIACNNVPAHFKNTHGIKRLKGYTPIHCWWHGCHKFVKRQNFVRHIRECHLGHLRKKEAPLPGLRLVMDDLDAGIAGGMGKT